MHGMDTASERGMTVKIRNTVLGQIDFFMRAKIYYIYILASHKNGTLYIGVTNDLAKRCQEHIDEVHDRFTKKYGVKRLVYYEDYPSVAEAIGREKQLKEWNRQWKIDLIEQGNPEWFDLYKLMNG